MHCCGARLGSRGRVGGEQRWEKKEKGKQVTHKIYHLDYFEINRLVVLNIFTLVGNKSPNFLILEN